MARTFDSILSPHDTVHKTTGPMARCRMAQNFGMESHGKHTSGVHRPPARYLVVIDSAGESVARLFTDTRVQVAEFDASTEEVAVMTRGLVASRDASAAEWDRPLEGHTAEERDAAEVYTLDV